MTPPDEEIAVEHPALSETEQDRLRALLEAALFAAPEPVPLPQLARALGQPSGRIRSLLTNGRRSWPAVPADCSCVSSLAATGCRPNRSITKPSAKSSKTSRPRPPCRARLSKPSRSLPSSSP